MSICKRNIVTCLLLILSLSGYSQNLDSLKLMYESAPNDTLKAKILVDMTDVLFLSRPDTVIPLCELAIRIIDRNMTHASEKERKSFLSIKASALGNIGYIFKNQGNIPKALDYYSQSLKIYENMGDKSGAATILNNLSVIYLTLNDEKSALEVNLKSLKMREELKDKRAIANSLHNLAEIYENQGDTAKALSYFYRNQKINEEINDKDGLALTFNEIGVFFSNRKDYSKAIEYFKKSLVVSAEIKNKRETAYSLNYLATALFKLSKSREALKYAEMGFKLSNELGYPDNIQNGSLTLSKIYADIGNYKRAYEMHLIYKSMVDSVNNEKNQRLAIQKEFQYNYDKKIVADSIKSMDEKKIVESEKNQEKVKQNALYICIFLVSVFCLFIYNRFRITAKQNRVIEKQKIEVDKQRELADSRREISEAQREVISIKQKEILDSIVYARRIQQSLLPSEKYIEKNMNRLKKNK